MAIKKKSWCCFATLISIFCYFQTLKYPVHFQNGDNTSATGTEENAASLTPPCGCLCHCRSLVSSRSRREEKRLLFSETFFFTKQWFKNAIWNEKYSTDGIFILKLLILGPIDLYHWQFFTKKLVYQQKSLKHHFILSLQQLLREAWSGSSFDSN